MMKWGFALNALAGAALVVTAVGFQSSGSQDLGFSLDRATHEIEELAGLRARLAKGDPTAIAGVLQHSEAPGPDPRTDEERLAQLRYDVSRLQMEWDALAATLPVEASPAGATAGKPSSGPATSPAAGDAKSGAGASVVAYESTGFSVDPLKEGEAYYRAGKYDAALKVLRTKPDDARCQYWSARALEQLGRVDEALAIYTTVAARKDAGWAGARAQTDLEFLQWKRDGAGKAGAGRAVSSGGSP